MNRIRALNVRTVIEELPGRDPDSVRAGAAPATYITPLKPALPPAPEEAGGTAGTTQPNMPRRGL